ncbi:hypothetical protein FRACYDRAFT_247042 [Fragilariopsis cylindrus CCMP1102]|uniref:SAP domain-containing protein n=1 Tax=Fragilariopsis cylindrus CCMP1102 TaxID=635003 RepID=A0A1E7EXG6_9STRA|nr:hypothetical protein FRACYDRAFT_247042 [Fragilariopsis cylindrus CCMP1102]|eukprot:OEU10505.1 hypothetical protein FRACYDRAFT_247042 [Fragilariopsis cylindrus CCMP1102]
MTDSNFRNRTYAQFVEAVIMNRQQISRIWFEELNASQCKELCKAVKVRCSGTKKNIIERLLDQEFLVQYAINLKRYMIKIDALKAECRKRMLQVSGNKFDLVLRIVQHEHGTGGDTLKRPATSIVVDETSGIEKHVAKKRKPSKPSPSTMYTRIQKKIRSCSQKKYQSHWGSKSHAPAVCSLVHSLLESLDKYTETDPNLVVDGCYAIVSSFVENFDYFDRPGYCEDLEDSAEKIIQYVVYDIPRNMVSSNDLDKLANIMIEWQNVAAPYGVLNNRCLGFDIGANLIRNGRGADEEEEDKKPPAAVAQAPINKKFSQFSNKKSGGSSTTSTGDCWLKVAVATTSVRSKGTASRCGLSLSQFTNKKSGGGGGGGGTMTRFEQQNSKRLTKEWHCQTCHKIFSLKPKGCFTQNHQVRTNYNIKKSTTKDEQRTKLRGKSADDDGLTLGSGIDWSNGNDRVGQNRFN